MIIYIIRTPPKFFPKQFEVHAMLTWVEFALGAAFAGAIAYSVRFCVNNYTRRSKTPLGGDSAD